MRTSFFDPIRQRLAQALTSNVGDDLAAVRLARRSLQALNDRWGRPIPTDVETTAPQAAAPMEPAPSQPAGPLGDPAQPAQIYGQRGDLWTQRAVDLLAGKGSQHQFVDLDDPAQPELPHRLAQETGRNTAPYVFVRGQFIGGFNALDELERLGQLDERLAGPSAATNQRPRIRIEIAEREEAQDLPSLPVR
jgi:glutaredoxin